MSRVAPILFVLAALVIAGVFLFGGEDEHDPDLDIGADDWGDSDETPELRKAKGVTGPSPRKRSEAPTPPPTEADAPRGRTKWITGTVLDAATGKPIPGATLRGETAGAPCPRISADLRIAARIPAARTFPVSSQAMAKLPFNQPAPLLGTATSDERGRFTWWVGDVRTLSDRHDVTASAPGYVTGMACAPDVGDDVTIRLDKAVALEVEVQDAFGRPLEGADVMVRPGPETRPIPGTAGAATSDENGKARVEGLRPGVLDPETGKPTRVQLHVDHPAWMPATSEPFDPKAEPQQVVKLKPALRLTLRIRSDDGTGIENPLLDWQTDGTPPAKDLTLLTVVEKTGPENEPSAELVTAPVRIPCEHRTVALEVKADGFAPWRQKEPLPSDGDARELIVVLQRNTALASLTLTYQNAAGETVPYRELGAQPPEITHLDGVDIGSLTVEQGETLDFKSLPAGRYRITKRSADYAPASIDVEVRTGEPTRATVRLEPAAKLRVRFLSSTRVMVEFRLLRDGRVLPAFPVSEDGDAGAGGGVLRAEGEEGALFTGLPAGPCTVEVTSTELVATPARVDLKQGETTEVDIDVRER